MVMLAPSLPDSRIFMSGGCGGCPDTNRIVPMRTQPHRLGLGYFRLGGSVRPIAPSLASISLIYFLCNIGGQHKHEGYWRAARRQEGFEMQARRPNRSATLDSTGLS